jgi:hydroxymethylglutaryl-CoA lyase
MGGGSILVNKAIQIVECPRDAWQGLPGIISPDTKATYLRRLIDAGFTYIDAVSFVSPIAVPQMADSERVLELLDPPANVDIIGIVVNRIGAERAIRTGRVHTLGFPYSVSPEFLRRNQHQTPEGSLEELAAIVTLARSAHLNVVAYVSMAFGNPYGDPWDFSAVARASEQLAQFGVQAISLADTVGLAPPERIAETVDAVIASQPNREIGVHLHARRSDAPSRIRAAFNAGCRRFDSAIGGLGGCPFAQDDLVGNIPTEVLLSTLSDCGAALPEIAALDKLAQVNAEIAAAAQGSDSEARPTRELSS